jgi:hypothetical protein
MFHSLENTVVSVVASLRWILNTQAVRVNLADQIEWLATIREPKTEIERDALIMTVRDAITDFLNFAGIEEDCGHSVCSEYLVKSAHTLYTAIHIYDR